MARAADSSQFEANWSLLIGRLSVWPSTLRTQLRSGGIFSEIALSAAITGSSAAALRRSLDEIFAEKLDPRFHRDAVEGKLFGLGSESYVVGSHEFYLGYAVENGTLLSGQGTPNTAIAGANDRTTDRNT